MNNLSQFYRIKAVTAISEHCTEKQERYELISTAKRLCTQP